ncbi:xanthine dehydrogenase family protein molybdopterin-binding subunit [Muricauda sp. CAU 1633]|uniref:xanthine dehydrogenase family protein molybdopterin-binding subunit n=1 Tax=Allomuricauda sp. CAU 1633 TaxID=2816036 RepID=UPI001A8F1ADD|nr:molybdopterin cofactor-binding domain-containing protein [Muricauda sp. CAU 1633]MBO0321514.1 xanthine dehydrogenase family protein molybdopterin-binding subunit [Muricauda sp. CAU 1633]
MKRRHFFKTSTLASGGFLISAYLPFSCNEQVLETESWEPNFYVRIDPDNTITFICSRTELGQGTSVGLAMIVADELGMDFENLKTEFADGAIERYGDLQDTGGSNGLRMLWEPLRKAIATAREIFIVAAAQKWQLDPSDCFSENGFVYHNSSERKASYASLITLAKDLPAPFDIKLKDPSDYKYIGKRLIGERTRIIAEGKNPYSINVKLPNMLYAAVARCPTWNGNLIDFDDSKARSFPGVVDVIEVTAVEIQPDDFKGGVRSGVAVLASNTWAALEAKKLLEIQWDLGNLSRKSDTDVKEELLAQLEEPRTVTPEKRDIHNLFNRYSKGHEATYFSAYQTTTCMEPLNATAYHMGHKIEIWVGSQAPGMFRERISELTGLPEAAITIHNLPSGGGFGRRFHADYVEEAVLISEKVRKPVKLTWSREDTITTSKYHPYCVDHWEAAFNPTGEVMAIAYKGTIGSTNAYRPNPYALPMVHYNYVAEKGDRLLPRASWRSVFAHPWALGLECFIDELAHLAKKDPIAYRIELLDKAEVVEQVMEPWVGDNLYPKKLKETLEIVREKSNWGQVSEGIFQGVSGISYNTSYCSQVIDLSVEDGKVKVHKVTAVLNCGRVINPSQVESQIAGGIIWGLSAALKTQLTVVDGQVQQTNFDSYDLLRMNETPEIEVHLVDSNDEPSGAGEPGVPGVAPALLNAIFAATGERIRQIPIVKSSTYSIA